MINYTTGTFLMVCLLFLFHPLPVEVIPTHTFRGIDTDFCPILSTRDVILIIRIPIFFPGGKGWETSLGGSNQILSQLQSPNTPAVTPDRRRESERQARDDRRRASQAAGPNVVLPPSPAIVRHNSRQQQPNASPRVGAGIPNALTPGGGIVPPHLTGQQTPLSAANQVDVPIGTPNRRLSQQINGGQQMQSSHPYASANAGGYDVYGGIVGSGVGRAAGNAHGGDEYSASQQAQYGRTSPMVSTVGAGAGGVVPPAVSNVRAVGGEVGVANGFGDGMHPQGQQGYGEERGNTFWRILTCRCG